MNAIETAAKKLADSLAYPPRLLRAERAAAYVAMSTNMFLRMVDAGEMPAPIKLHAMTVWDRLDLDAAVEVWKEKRSSKNPLRVALGLEEDDDHH